MKRFIKFLLVCGCAACIAWIVATRTSWGQDYMDNVLPHDITTIKGGILTALDATGAIVSTGADMQENIVLSDTGSVIVDDRILNERLEYYKKSKKDLWK